VADGIQRTTRAIRAEVPDAVITHVEAAGLWFTEDAGLRAEAVIQNDRKFLPTDLVTGAVTTDHPQHGFLRGAGVSAATLARLRDAAQLPDLIGVNYYPTLSGRELVRRDGDVVEVAAHTGAAGLRTVLTEYHERYRRPVFLSETALDGEPADHIAWLRESTEAVADLRAAGVPVTGYTWWPLFDFVDWAWASGGRVVEEFHVRDADGTIRAVAPPHGDDVTAYLRRMGLYRLVRTGADLTTQTTPAATEFRKLAGQPAPEPRNRP
jgi:beta-glucosidase